MSMIFIVGVGRSGTSLLHSMIGAHPDVVAVPETSFLRRIVFSPNTASVTALKEDSKLDRFEGLRAALVAVNYAEDRRLEAYKNAIQDLNANFVVDKDPRLVEYVPLLKKAFPTARIIHIYRDPRDILASKKEASWSSGRSLVSYLIASRAQIADALLAEERGEVLSIKYEDLISSPQQTLEQATQYLGLSFQAEMLNYTQTAEKLLADDEFDWKKETLKPVITNNHGKWVDKLKPVEMLSTELVVRNIFRKGNYQIPPRSVSGIDHIKALLIAWCVILLTTGYKLHRGLSRFFNRKS